MARVTYVKKAQPRYRTVPVLVDGQPVKTPVMRRNGEQKKTKSGRLVFMTKTVEDKSQPLPLRNCDYCGKPIEIGTPYKHVTPKSGPYGGRLRARHAACPTWQEWDLSNSLSAQLARVSHETTSQTFTDADEVRSALESAADQIEEIADAKEESAQNVEDGFGHETETSQQLREVADNLKKWAEEIREKAGEVEERPDEEVDCSSCGGTGRVGGDDDADDGVDECAECGASGQIENPEIADWESNVEDWLSIVDEVPV